LALRWSATRKATSARVRDDAAGGDELTERLLVVETRVAVGAVVEREVLVLELHRTADAFGLV